MIWISKFLETIWDRTIFSKAQKRQTNYFSNIPTLLRTSLKKNLLSTLEVHSRFTVENLMFWMIVWVRCKFKLIRSHTKFWVSNHYFRCNKLAILLKKRSFCPGTGGLLKFYTSFTLFKRQFIDRAYVVFNSEEDDQALTMEQLKRPMILIVCLWGMSIMIWIAEIIIYRWKNRRNHEQQPQGIA